MLEEFNKDEIIKERKKILSELVCDFMRQDFGNIDDLDKYNNLFNHISESVFGRSSKDLYPAVINEIKNIQNSEKFLENNHLILVLVMNASAYTSLRNLGDLSEEDRMFFNDAYRKSADLLYDSSSKGRSIAVDITLQWVCSSKFCSNGIDDMLSPITDKIFDVPSSDELLALFSDDMIEKTYNLSKGHADIVAKIGLGLLREVSFLETRGDIEEVHNIAMRNFDSFIDKNRNVNGNIIVDLRKIHQTYNRSTYYDSTPI